MLSHRRTSGPDRGHERREVKPVEVAVGVLAVADAGDNHRPGCVVDGVDDAVVADTDPSKWR